MRGGWTIKTYPLEVRPGHGVYADFSFVGASHSGFTILEAHHVSRERKGFKRTIGYVTLIGPPAFGEARKAAGWWAWAPKMLDQGPLESLEAAVEVLRGR